MKNKMLKCLLLILMGGSMLSTKAQHDSLPAEKMAYRLKNHLNLSDDQTLKIKEIYKVQGQKMKAVKQSTDSADVKRATMKQLRADTDRQVMAVLTPEQQKQYAAVKEKVRDNRRQKIQQHRNGKAPAKTAPDEDDF